jgi:hypothetical protein
MKDLPLAAVTARQAKALVGAWGDGVIVDYAMRYGRPAIAERLDALKAQGCERILIAPFTRNIARRRRLPPTMPPSAPRHLALATGRADAPAVSRGPALMPRSKK